MVQSVNVDRIFGMLFSVQSSQEGSEQMKPMALFRKLNFKLLFFKRLTRSEDYPDLET